MKKRFFISILFILCIWSSFAQNDCPCCTKNHKAFDFWVGEWQVKNADGSLAGTNVITKIEDGCALLEKWKGASGTTGTSTNFYNTTSDEWEQLWVDNSGAHLKLKGNRQNGRMILSSNEFLDKEGKKTLHRITWTPNEDGTVRQLWEVIKENEKISIAFDGLYSKIEN